MKSKFLFVLALAATVTGFAAVEEAIDSRFKPAPADPLSATGRAPAEWWPRSRWMNTVTTRRTC